MKKGSRERKFELASKEWDTKSTIGKKKMVNNLSGRKTKGTRDVM